MLVATDILEIQKRDGRIVAFDRSKIVAAIMKAAQALQGSDYRLAEDLAAIVLTRVSSDGEGKIPTVEAIQDTIERVLIEQGHARTAKAFILYRARRSRIREGKSELMDAVGEILRQDAGPTPGSGLPRTKRVAIGLAASREFYLNRVLPEAMADAHMQGDLHLHGLADYGQAPHSVVLPYSTLLGRGFTSGYGFIRTPRRAASAVALTAVALQAAQADCHGGQVLATFDTDLAQALPETLDAHELDQAMESLIYSLNTMPMQGGDHLPFTTLQVGLDVTPRGRAVTAALLTAAARGLGRGEAALRPHVAFVLRAGVNLHPGDPNFDLTREALSLASRRMLVTFVHDAEGVAYAGHEARLARTEGLSEGLGQVARVSVNLPRLALKARRDGRDFMEALDAGLALAAKALAHRLDTLGARPAAEFPFLMGQGLWHGAEALSGEQPILPALANGTFAICLVGLAETLMVLSGQHHGSSPSSQAEGLQLIKRAAERTAELSAELDLRLVLQAGEAEGVGERFARLDRREFGMIKGVTEVAGYSAGVALPLDAGLDWQARLKIEGAYAAMFTGGCFTRTPMAASPSAEEALAWLQVAIATDHRAFGLDVPLALCGGCGQTAAPAAECARCGSPSTVQRPIGRRRGYLTLG